MMSRSLLFALAAAVLALDRFTKWIIETYVSVWDSFQVIPGFFNIVHTQNRGAAFGLLSDGAPEWRAMLLIGLSGAALLGIAGYLLHPSSRRPGSSWLVHAALALILGGALGNVFDRIVFGAVTDFLQFYIGRFEWPAFNVADSAITVGAGLILLDTWVLRRPPEQEQCSQKP
jgi:signal peptidase II